MLSKYLLGLFLYFITTTVCAAVQVEIDKDKLASDETLTLLLSSKDHISITPDLSPLKKDFYVVGTSQSSQFKMINGSTQMETQWQIALLPKHTGDILLPSIQVGNEKTTPLLVHVSATKGSNSSPVASQNQDVFMEATIVPKEAYIQEQFVYTLKLFYSRTIENPYLAGPDLADAKISQNGQDILYTTSKNGKYFRVLERSYLITPKNVGSFQVAPAILKGYLEQQARTFDIYGFTTNTMQPIKIVGPTISIKVKPKPTTYNGQWFPAKKLTWVDRWENNNNFREGEPATRILEITVEGATGEQIPPLALGSTANLNIYPQQPQRETNANGNNQLGKMIQKIVYIPTASGKINLPPMKIHWWNSVSQKEMVSVIPAKTIKVLPALVKDNTAGASQIFTQNTTTVPVKNKAEITQQTSHRNKNSVWPFVAILFIIIWLVTLLLWRRQMMRGDGRKISLRPKKMSVSERQRRLKEACMVNNAKQARRHFLAWSVAYWKDPSLHALSDVVFFLDEDEASPLKAQIMQLEAVFYSKTKRDWHGAAFWAALQDYLKLSGKKTQAKDDPLPPLYPSHS